MQITATPGPKLDRPARDRAPPGAPRAAPSTTPSATCRAGRASPASAPARRRAPSSSAHLGPGAVLDEAVEHLVQDAYREALVEEDILPLTNADVEVVQAEEGKPLIFKATVQVRPEVSSATTSGFNFGPEIETIDDAQVDKVIEELRDQNATLAAGRGPRRAGRRLRGHRLRRHARRRAVRGRHDRADAADPRPGAADPGLRGEPRRPRSRRLDRVRHHLPRRLPARPSWPGRPAHFAVELQELREKILPELDDDFARHARRLRRPRRAPGRDQDAPRAQRPRPGAPRVRRQDHRVRGRQRDASSCPTSWSTRRSR